jgi:(p)ppGpp synthase/HD superfamily hydrolase
MRLLGEADAFAERKHRGQFRRDGKTPYVEHPRAVCRILRDEFGVTDPEVLAAGLLHDTLEDTTTDFDDLASRFGRRVATLVAVLTKDKRLPESRREREYFAGLARAPLAAALCKLADTLHNCRDADGPKRAKAVGKARRLLRVLRPAPALRRAVDLLRRELSR